MYLVLIRTIPPAGDKGEGASAVQDASRVKRHAATSQVQYLRDHIRFISHQGRQILLLDLSNCSAAEVEKFSGQFPKL